LSVNLVLLDPSELDTSGRVHLTDARAWHLLSVLKVTPSQTVRIGVIDGPRGAGTVTDVTGDAVTLQCQLETARPERPRVDLLLALPRPKVLRRLWAHLAAVGVGRVLLTNAEKVERDYFDSHLVREEGFLPLLLEGLQQAQDTRMPIISVHKRLKVLVEDELDALCPSTRRLLAHPGASSTVIPALESTPPHERVLLAVGPEGGWNDVELALLESHGFARVSMGARTLATTTACIALLTLVHAGSTGSTGSAGHTANCEE
jgi:16S rRNA (uracil1498-N3)-methyltransferase